MYNKPTKEELDAMSMENIEKRLNVIITELRELADWLAYKSGKQTYRPVAVSIHRAVWELKHRAMRLIGKA